MGMNELMIALYDSRTEEKIDGPPDTMRVETLPAVGSTIEIWMDSFEDRTDTRSWIFQVERVTHELRIMGRGKVVQTALLFVLPLPLPPEPT